MDGRALSSLLGAGRSEMNRRMPAPLHSNVAEFVPGARCEAQQQHDGATEGQLQADASLEALAAGPVP
eukprot:1654209-Pyramimonas_sp.AAC.1